MDEIVRVLFFSPLPQGLFLLLFLLYLWMILWFRRGWCRLEPFEESCRDPRRKVTVIVPCRNEADHLPALAEALAAQSYPADLTEIVFVDDHSADNSRTVMEQLAGRYGNIRVMRNRGRGKKEALLTALESCTTEWVFTTDADGRPGKEWIAVMMAYQRRTGASFIAGPVEVVAGKGFFSRFRVLEFYSLTGAGLGAAAHGHPLYCNGASLAYERKVVERYGDPLRRKIPGGDDVFLLHAVKRDDPAAVRFLKSRAAAVTVSEEEDIRSFFHQRRRWASKATAYRDSDTIITALLVLLMNMLLLFTLFAGFFRWEWWLWCGLLWGVKSVADLLLLKEVVSFYGQRPLLRIFPAAQLLYPFYLAGTALAGIFSFSLRKEGW